MPSKPCATCGRVITWRKKWLRCWEQIQHCSQRCRRHRTTDQDRKLEGAIIDLLDRRAVTATICPSEAAKTIGDEDWRSLMEPTRAAARRLHARKQIDILQRGQLVDPSTAKGAIRLRRRRAHA